jgi:outer membrane protein, multidrug efflux system
MRKREGALANAVSSSAESMKFGRAQLEQGQVDMFTILRLGGENLGAKVQLTQIRASRLRERVNLYLALGGDFEGTGAPK